MNKFFAQKKISLLKALVIFSVVFSSCASTKNVPYFQNVIDSGFATLPVSSVFKEPTIQPDDILSISIFTIDPATSMVINQLGTQIIGSTQSNTANTNLSASGFLVDKNGEIQLSVVGKVKLLGLTTFEARDLIQRLASKSYNMPNVQVRFANFKVTILGEVLRPATYTIPNEKLTVLDALGLAGDLTIFGRRENILLIRESNEGKEFARLNLNSSALFSSPYYYLKQNDVLYVEPNKGKAASLNTARTQTIALIGTGLSVLLVLFSRL